MNTSDHLAWIAGRWRECGELARVAIALLAAAMALLPGPAAHAAAMYKCTTAAGALIYSDRPCANDGSASAADHQGRSAAVVEQEVLRLPEAAASGSGLPSAQSIRRRCEAPVGTSLSPDAAMRDLPERQQQAFAATLTGVALSGLSRADMQASTLHMDARQTLVWCLPKADRGFAAWLVESNGRIVELHRSGKVEAHNDANDPITLANRCSAVVTTCFEPGKPGHSLDQCFASAAACPAGRLDPGASCCPQTCKDAYQRKRAAGVDPLTASSKVLFGDAEPGSTCTLSRDGG